MYPALLPAVQILLRRYRVRIALFTAQELVSSRGVATTIELLRGHLPRDLHVIDYHPGSDRFSGLRADKILQRAQRDRIDLIHLATCGPVAIVALLVAWRLNVPVVGSLPADFASTPLRRKYLGALSQQCERVFAPSSAARARLTAAGINPSTIVTWRPGVDAELFTQSKRSAALRERWQVSDSRPAVIYVGALSEEKSSRRLLSLETGLCRSNPMHRLIVVGDGPGRAELENRCPHAVFMGAMPHDEVPEILASADLFVCPSSGVVCRSSVDLIVETAGLIRNDLRRKAMGRAAREHAVQQRVDAALAPLHAEYRAAAEISDVRREFRPALVSQSRRL